MNTLVILSVVALVAGSVSAHGGGPGGNKGGNRGGQGGYGGWPSWDCNAQCSYQCLGNTGNKNVGCYTNRTAYIQCQDTTCTVQACPANQLFNNTARTCQACPTGYKVNEQQTRCVCNTGTTYDRTTRSCVTCPTDSVIAPDYCYCNNSAFDKTRNACRQCPTGSTLRKGCCQCNSRDAFWNQQAFDCQQCPGAWVLKNVTSRGFFFGTRYRTYNVCECQTPGQVFNRYSVSCVTCPSDSVVSTTKTGESYCSCNQAGFKYYERNNTCVDRYSFRSGDNDGTIEFSLEGILKDIFGSSEDHDNRRG